MSLSLGLFGFSRGAAAFGISGITLQSRLLTSYNSASLNNYCDNIPWNVVPDWQPSTLYKKQEVVKANGHQYVQLYASGTSGTTAPSQTRAITFSDGTCLWIPAQDSKISTNDPRGPTITPFSAEPAFSGVMQWYGPAIPSVFQVTGGTPYAYVSTNLRATGAKVSAGATNDNGYIFSTIVEDEKFSVSSTSNSPPMGIAIDGRLLSAAPFIPSASAVSGLVFDFSATTGRQARRLDLISCAPGGVCMASVGTTAHGILSAPADSKIKAVFLGDSFDDGSSYGPFTAFGQWGTQLGARMGWDVFHMSKGGTGVIASGGFYTYPQRVADTSNAAVLSESEVLFVNGSTNDVGNSTGSITSAVLQTLSNIRLSGFKGVIFWFGPASINKSAGPTFAQIQSVDSAMSTAFSQWVDPVGLNMAFYFPFANADQPPIDGSYRTGGPSGIDTYTQFINQGDGVHPTDAGTYLLARYAALRVASVLRLVGS